MAKKKRKKVSKNGKISKTMHTEIKMIDGFDSDGNAIPKQKRFNDGKYNYLKSFDNKKELREVRKRLRGKTSKLRMKKGRNKGKTVFRLYEKNRMFGKPTKLDKDMR